MQQQSCPPADGVQQAALPNLHLQSTGGQSPLCSPVPLGDGCPQQLLLRLCYKVCLHDAHLAAAEADGEARLDLQQPICSSEFKDRQ